jgi:L-lysine exporter family protein LysE/ArgO
MSGAQGGGGLPWWSVIALSPSVLVAGLAFGLSLIVAIGAQNAFVLRQGAVGRYVGSVVAICTVSDVVLIVAGVAGAGAALDGHPTAFTVARIAGAAALLGYAALAGRRALHPGALGAEAGTASSSRAAVLGATMAFTWLNPAVYLDTLVLLGSVAAGTHRQRWSFAAGACLGSALWFTALGYGARQLGPLLRSPRAWRVLDGSVALVMTVTAVRVLLGA